MMPIRTAALLFLGAASGSALAENYVGTVYGTPAGYTNFFVTGAGDNGMMTGYARHTATITDRPIYLTPQGFRDLNPSGFSGSAINDSWGGTYHVGNGWLDGSRALYWVGGSNAAVNLHPANAPFASSRAEAVAGQVQVGRITGEVNGVNLQDACMWSRTAASFRVLPSPNHHTTEAVATDGGNHVGIGRTVANNRIRALLWTGPTANPIDLEPSTGVDGSWAEGVDGNQVVGYTHPDTGPNYDNAALWIMNGSQFTHVNLNPSATFYGSKAIAVRNKIQVGFGWTLVVQRKQAILWHGAASSWTNLHAKLPTMYHTWESAAQDIDNQGNVVGYVQNKHTLEYRAVIWRRVP